MASSYALPVSPPGGNHHHHYQHQHSHSYTPSYSAIQLSPKKERTNSFGSNRGNGYGHQVRKAGSNGSLYTHAEVSPERGSIPPPLPNLNDDYLSTLQRNAFAFQTNNRSVESLHKHSHQYSSSSMKSRPRGESDLGRPQQPASNGAARNTLGPLSWLSVPEALTSLLIPLPFLFISATHSPSRDINEAPSPLSAYAKLQHAVLDDDGIAPHAASRAGLSWVDTCIITSGTLLLVGGLARMRASTRTTESRKDKPEQVSALRNLVKLSTMRDMTSRALSVGLPFFAAITIGGLRTGTILLVSYTASMAGQTRYLDAVSSSWKQKLASRTVTLSLMGIALLSDLAGITSSVPFAEVIVGYVALTCAMLMLDSPLPKSVASDSSRAAHTPTATTKFSWSHLLPVSSLTRTVHDVNLTLTTGIVTSTVLLLASLFTSNFWNLTLESMVLDSIAAAGSATAIFLSRPASLQTRHKAGLGLGCLCIALCTFRFSPSFSLGTICNLAIIALFYLSVYYDTTASETHQHHEHHDHDHDHAHSTHEENQRLSSDAKHSAFTRLILSHCEPDSLVYGIVSEKDSRRIAYFTLLNFGFMLVQGLYGYLSGSLGLLSDTVHMFFDCLGLVIGLAAAVASKWPISPEKPYGWGKLNTLAGFGNGIFLMLVSVEFVWEAIEGILEHRELRHVQELLVVSSLGLMVNMVGLFAFGHAHAGHDHGHGHGHGNHHDHSHDHAHHDHSHSHSHEGPHAHEKSHTHSHDHSHSHGHGHSHSHSDLSQAHVHEHRHNESQEHSKNHTHEHEHDHHTHEHQAQSQTHVHDHHNENMHGIYLHVAADAGGSLAVIVSTLLTLWSPWYLWDPLATIIIAILIFAAAVPLVISSGQKLLLVVPDQLEYSIKDTLQGLGELRGVIGYAVPRFWIDDKDAAGDSHGHHHHGHDHSSSTGCEKILGVIHIIAAQTADLEDVRRWVDDFVRSRNMELVIHVEREGEDHGQCWCSGG